MAVQADCREICKTVSQRKKFKRILLKILIGKKYNGKWESPWDMGQRDIAKGWLAKTEYSPQLNSWQNQRLRFLAF